MIASPAGGHHIRPDMRAAQVPRHDMVNRQIWHLSPAILAGIIIPAEDFATGQLDSRSRALDHVFQAYHGWKWKAARYCLDNAPTVGNQRGSTVEHHPDRPACIAHIEWLKIGIEYQNQCVHGLSVMP